nr:pentatricopeptide repeat-containing protein [Tanacetum cinerariifolium]
MAALSCNDLVFEVNNDGVTSDGKACVDVGGSEEVVAEDVVSDDGVDVGGGEEANLDEEVRVTKILDKDYLSDGEKEVTQLRKQKSKAKTLPKNTRVMKQVAGSSRSKRLYKMGDSETIIEHKEFMDDLLWKLRGDGCGTTDPFQLVATKVEKYPIHDEDTYLADEETKGWKLGCRRIIALDGCFLKKPNVGEIVTAIERDDNSHIFSVAWAVVNVKNKDNWSWCLHLLGEDLDSYLPF